MAVMWALAGGGAAEQPPASAAGPCASLPVATGPFGTDTTDRFTDRSAAQSYGRLSGFTSISGSRVKQLTVRMHVQGGPSLCATALNLQ
jgi:hypothetical protein